PGKPFRRQRRGLGRKYSGRMLVSISFAAEAEPSCAVSPSAVKGNESLTSVAPSTRQNFSASSLSTRLHVGQRFISSECCDLTQLFQHRMLINHSGSRMRRINSLKRG